MSFPVFSCWGATHVLEILRTAPSAVTQVLLDESARQPMEDIRKAAAAARIAVRNVSREEIREAGGEDARLVVALLKPFQYRTLEDLVRAAEVGQAGRPASLPGAPGGQRLNTPVAPAPLHAGSQPEAEVAPAAASPRRICLLALDSVTDPGNLGAIARSARFFGASGIVLPQDRSVEVTAAAVRRSAGALLSVPVARVINLVRALKDLKDHGYWTYCAMPHGGVEPLAEKFPERSVLVLGAEDVGVRPLVSRTCDIALTIPGAFESLNVSACAAVLLYAWSRKGAMFVPRG